MLDISYWLNVASTVSSKAEDKDFLAKEYAGYWLTSKMTKKVHENLTPVIDELKMQMTTGNKQAKHLLDQFTSICSELGIE